MRSDHLNNVIELRSISKEFKEFSFDSIDLQIKQGYTTGLIGANGTGKTTLIKLIMNLLKPDEGEVRVFGLITRHMKNR